jgi:hypothetical protein
MVSTMVKVALMLDGSKSEIGMQRDTHQTAPDAKSRSSWERPALRKMQAADARRFTKKQSHGDLNHFSS